MTVQDTTIAVPQNFEQCMLDCFAQMGSQTREFVLSTIKNEINVLINSTQFDVNHYKQIIQEIVNILDGDDQQKGFQRFVQLINDVSILKQTCISQTDVENIIQRILISTNVSVGNNFVVNLVKNETFVNEIRNNSVIVNSMITSVTNTIINYLSRPDGDALGNQFVVMLNQFINNQVQQINNNVNIQISQFKSDLTNQVNVSIDNVQNNLTRINTELMRINTWINNCSSKDELLNIRKELEGFNSLRIQFIQLQSDVNELAKKCGDVNFYSNIDLSRNISIVNIMSQLAVLNQNITDVNIRISQYSNFVSRNDLANACAAACAVFVQTLTGNK